MVFRSPPSSLSSDFHRHNRAEAQEQRILVDILLGHQPPGDTEQERVSRRMAMDGKCWEASTTGTDVFIYLSIIEKTCISLRAVFFC